MKISQVQLKDLLDYSCESGLFIWKTNRQGHVKAGDAAGQSGARGRVSINVMGRRYPASHLAWLYVYGLFPTYELDHIDGNCSNNKISNLRDVDHKTNLENRTRANTRSTGRSSSLLGVSWKKDKSKWVANISALRVTKHLGYFDNEADAHQAYLDEKRKIHRGNTL